MLSVRLPTSSFLPLALTFFSIDSAAGLNKHFAVSITSCLLATRKKKEPAESYHWLCFLSYFSTQITEIIIKFDVNKNQLLFLLSTVVLSLFCYSTAMNPKYTFPPLLTILFCGLFCLIGKATVSLYKKKYRHSSRGRAHLILLLSRSLAGQKQ